jgi:predicted nucleic acid-binding protein
VYADSSALVKLVIAEPESAALQSFLAGTTALASSQLAMVEVPRAVAMANPAEAVRADVDRVLEGCRLIAVTAAVLRSARRLASASLRTLDAIHLASALHIDADELLAYDESLAAAAAAAGLATVSPGC